MASSKSPLLRPIRKAFMLSEVSRQPNAPDIKELVRQVDQARAEYSRRRFIGDVSKAAMFAGLAAMLPGCTKEDFVSQYEEIEKVRSRLDNIPNYTDYFLVNDITVCKPEKLTKFDYLLIMDADGVNNRIDYRNLEDSIKKKNWKKIILMTI